MLFLWTRDYLITHQSMMLVMTLQQTPFNVFSYENYVIYNTQLRTDVIESRFYLVQRLNTLLL